MKRKIKEQENKVNFIVHNFDMDSLKIYEWKFIKLLKV